MKTMKELLKEIEFVIDSGTSKRHCPHCWEIEEDGHSDGCELKAALNAPDPASTIITDLFEKQEILRMLAKDKSAAVRTGVAANKNIPSDVIELLAKDKSYTVLATLAENETIPLDILRALSNTESKSILRALGGNTNSPMDVIHTVFNKLTTYWEHDSLIDHPNISVETLKGIVNKHRDITGYVADKAQKKLDNLQGNNLINRATKGYVYQRVDIAAETNLPLDVINVLAKDKSPSVRASLAHSLTPTVKAASVQTTPAPVSQTLIEAEPIKPLTPDDIWIDLAKSGASEARERAASNIPLTNVDALMLLAQDRDEDVRQTVAVRDNLPLCVLEILAKDQCVFIKKLVALCEETPINILQTLAKDNDWQVKAAVAENPTFIKATTSKEEEPQAKEEPTPEVKQASSFSLPALLGIAGGAALAGGIMSAMNAPSNIRVANIPDVEASIEPETKMEASI